MQMNVARGRVAVVAPLDECEVRVVDGDKVAATRDRLPSPEETDALADWFKVLGDTTRARILYAVLEAGGRKFCYVRNGTDIEKRMLITGLNNSKFVEVKESAPPADWLLGGTGSAAARTRTTRARPR